MMNAVNNMQTRITAVQKQEIIVSYIQYKRLQPLHHAWAL